MQISKEAREGLTIVMLPPIGLEDDTYQEECDRKIREALLEVAKVNTERVKGWEESRWGPIPEQYLRPMVRTAYPEDDFESQDVVTMDNNGVIEILDKGSR